MVNDQGGQERLMGNHLQFAEGGKVRQSGQASPVGDQVVEATTGEFGDGLACFLSCSVSLYSLAWRSGPTLKES